MSAVATRRAAVRAALIDLDGTLLDTAPDIAAAANRMLASLGLPERGLEDIRCFIGQGSARLVRHCLQDAGADADREFDGALATFSRCYDEESGRRSRAYPGVAEGLREIVSQRVALACVTNKLTRFTLPLLRRTGLSGFFGTVVCGDTVSRLKPDPEPFVHACLALGVASDEAVVIGDSDNDVTAARAAGCRVLFVPYGYGQGVSVESLKCDAIVPDLTAAAAYIRRHNGQLQEIAK